MSGVMMNIVIRSRRNSSEDEEKKIELMISKLKKCGIPEHHCYKSLAATGFVDENLAAEWLVSHVDDPCLGDNDPRLFYLLLCPIDDFGSHVEEFWSACQSEVGWNEAHELPPAIPLLSDFQVSSRRVHNLHMACINVLNSFAQRGEMMHMVNIDIDYSETDNCIRGRLNHSTISILNALVDSLRQECLKVGVTIPSDKACGDLHMVLAQGAHVSDFVKLCQSCRETVQLSHACRWEARLYSKDPRIGNLWPAYQPRVTVSVSESDTCLAYSAGDCVVSDPSIAPFSDGWQQGFNINTGLSGRFPLNVCDRVPHFVSWTLHKSFRLNSSIPGSPISMNGDFAYASSTPGSDQCVFVNGNVFDSVCSGYAAAPSSPNAGATACASSSTGAAAAVSNGGHTRKSSGSSSVFRKNSESSSSMRKNSDSGLSIMAGLSGAGWSNSNPRRQVIVMRHGERVDFCFGKMWYSKSFDEKGVYKRLNLNMPAFLPSRLPADFAMDSPLTQLGLTLSHKTGHALMESNFQITHCFCSPALRCVQTADEVLRGTCQNQTVPIRIEPSLFEWLGWYQLCKPLFMTPEDLSDHGFNVDTEYKPLSRYEDFDFKESIERFYERQYKITKRLLESTKKKGGNILIVAHAGSLDACTRQLVTGKPARKKVSEVRRSMARVSYCAMLCIEERRVGGRWQYVEPCVLPFTHGMNRQFHWKDVIDDLGNGVGTGVSPLTPSYGDPPALGPGAVSGRVFGGDERYVAVSTMTGACPHRWSADAEPRDLGVGTNR